jgi:hypothetical protein
MVVYTFIYAEFKIVIQWNMSKPHLLGTSLGRVSSLGLYLKFSVDNVHDSDLFRVWVRQVLFIVL